MPIDAAKLLAFSIPEGRQFVSPRDVALYALSVGVGQDTLNPRILRFVDPGRAMSPLPSMALVLAHPGFWLSDPASGVDPTKVLHADQSFEILSPLPVEGSVTSRSRLISLVDKGQGKPALLRIETILTGAEDRPLARLLRTIFVRDGGGFGGEAATSAPVATPPGGTPDHVVDFITRSEQALLYRLNGDLNPLHSDPEVASRAGFARPILHGLCTAGIVGHAILQTLAEHNPERVRAIRLRFAGPVLPGETIRTEIWADGSFRARVVERDVVVIEDGRTSLAPRSTEHHAAEMVA